MKTRLPMTCKECWEREARNVHYESISQVGDARALEEVCGYRCPECGYEVTVRL